LRLTPVVTASCEFAGLEGDGTQASGLALEAFGWRVALTDPSVAELVHGARTTQTATAVAAALFSEAVGLAEFAASECAGPALAVDRPADHTAASPIRYARQVCAVFEALANPDRAGSGRTKAHAVYAGLGSLANSATASTTVVAALLSVAVGNAGLTDILDIEGLFVAYSSVRADLRVSPETAGFNAFTDTVDRGVHALDLAGHALADADVVLAVGSIEALSAIASAAVVATLLISAVAFTVAEPASLAFDADGALRTGLGIAPDEAARGLDARLVLGIPSAAGIPDFCALIDTLGNADALIA